MWLRLNEYKYRILIRYFLTNLQFGPRIKTTGGWFCKFYFGLLGQKRFEDEDRSKDFV